MTPKYPFDRWLGLFFLAFALFAIFIWIPLDTGSGIFETVRRRLVIGDAMGPTVAAAIVLIGGILIALKPNQQSAGITRSHVMWGGKLLVLFLVALLTMRFAGPVLLSMAEGGYRPLRGTIPWKYLGFLLGGTGMILGLNYAVAGRITRGDVIAAVISSLAIALAYDLPFDDLLLPPNGDI